MILESPAFRHGEYVKRDSKPILLPYRWVILAIMWSTILISLAAQFQVAALAYKIIPAFKLTSGQYSMILTAPMLAGVCFSFAAGALADRFGVKRVVAAGFVFSVVGVFFRYAAHNFGEMFILMFLAGICPGLLNANASKLLGAWFPREQMNTAMGIYSSANGMGMSIGLATSALFPTMKSAFVTAGIAMLIIAILWMVFIKAKPDAAPDLAAAMPVTGYMKVAAGSKNVWLVGMALMFLMGSSMVFSGFLPDALNKVYGMSPVTAGFMASIVTFGTIVGSIIGPFLSDRIGKIKPFIVPTAVLGAIAGYSSWLLSQSAVMLILFALYGIFLGICTPLLMAFPMLLPEIGPVYAGSAGGIIGTLQVIGAVFIPSFIITPLAGQNYTLLFALGSLSFLMVAVVSLLLPELGAAAQRRAVS